MLTVRDHRRRRSKSPGGRERSTSREPGEQSRARSPPRQVNTSSKKYYVTESVDENRRGQGKKTSKKYYDSDSDDGKSKPKKSLKKHNSASESEESDRRRRKSASTQNYGSDSDDLENFYNVDQRTHQRRDLRESDYNRQQDENKKSSQRDYDSRVSEESHRPRHPPTSHPGKENAQGKYEGYQGYEGYERYERYGGGRYPNYEPASYARPDQYIPGGPAGLPQSRPSYADHEQWRRQWAESERPAYTPTSPPYSAPAAPLTSPPYSSPNAPYSAPNAPYPAPNAFPTSPPYSTPAAPVTSPPYSAREAFPTSPPYSAPGAFPTSPHADSPDQREYPTKVASGGNFTKPAHYQYARDPNSNYTSKAERAYIPNSQQHNDVPQPAPYPQQVDVTPGTGKLEKHEKRYRYEAPPKQELASQLGRLAISGGAGAGAGLLMADPAHAQRDGGPPPASPLLEAYHGTYQSISPMPSPMMLAKNRHSDCDSSDLSDLSDLDLSKKSKSREKVRKAKEEHVETSGRQTSGRQDPSNAASTSPMMIEASPRTPKRVSFYNPVSDAVEIAAALAGTHHPPKTRPLISILPRLGTEDIQALRTEYKNHAKVSGKGINMAKHIKMRVPGNLGKAAYATALGRWESEAYWSNSWYQSGGSRRELLIESLMGRSNSEIWEIKNCFRDKRYSDDLEKCMRSELKADKFRLAILLALEERRQSDSAPLEARLIAQDVRDLHKALTSRDGGETAMIQIIVLRSDAHLREVLRAFERTFHINFAREMISKSRNLVGETLAHVLNGALNRPMRDALLLHQAIAETAPGKERAELLISRAVRLHWDVRHMDKVKRVYEERYQVSVGEALAKEVYSGMKKVEGREWVEFVAGCLDVQLDDHVRRERRGSGGGCGGDGAVKTDRWRSGGKDAARESGRYDLEERRPR